MSSRGYIPKNILWFSRLLKFFIGGWLRLFYTVEEDGKEIFDTLKPPYVLLSNHVSTRDPFSIGSLVPAQVYWVTSDGNMRTAAIRILLSMVGSIPKSKAIPDRETVRMIIDVIRKDKGIVGIFPEGQASWDGRTLPIIPSTGKLLKLLKVPVVSVVIEGGFFSLPRWTWTRRSGKLRFAYKLLLEREELAAMPVNEILERVERGLSHDEYACRSLEGISWKSPARAEFLELSLYACPICGEIGGIASRGHEIGCAFCGFRSRLDRSMRFKSVGASPIGPSTISEWDDIQARIVGKAAARAISEGRSESLFSDAGAILLRGRKMRPLERIGRGSLAIFRDRLEFVGRDGRVARFPIVDIEGAGVLKRNLFEFYIRRDLHQFRFDDRRKSARKWFDMSMALAAASRSRPGP